MIYRRLILPIALIATLVACSSKSTTSDTTTRAQANGDFSLVTRFSPDPPKQGAETITVDIKDASGSPVKGATVKIASNMPSMSMTGPTLTATDNGDGSYSAQTNLNYATQWAFVITVSAAGKYGKARVTQEVK